MKHVIYRVALVYSLWWLSCCAWGQTDRPAAPRRSMGNLQVGRAAPTFVLPTLEGDGEFDLRQVIGTRPVVLFFGSYT